MDVNIRRKFEKILDNYIDDCSKVKRDQVIDAADKLGKLDDDYIFLLISDAKDKAENENDYALSNFLTRTVDRIIARKKGEIDDAPDILTEPLTIPVTQVNNLSIQKEVARVLVNKEISLLEKISKKINQLVTSYSAAKIVPFIREQKYPLDLVAVSLLQLLIHRNIKYREIGSEILCELLKTPKLNTDFTFTIPYVIPLLSNRREIIKKRALFILETIGDDSVIEPIMERFDKDLCIQYNIIDFLSNKKKINNEVIEKLWKIMQEPIDRKNLSKDDIQHKENTKFIAAQELLKLPEPQIAKIKDYLEINEYNWGKEILAWHLWLLNDKEYNECIFVALRNPDSDVRIGGIKAVNYSFSEKGRSPSKEIVDCLIEILLQDNDPKVRNSCAIYTKRLRNESITNAIIEFLPKANLLDKACLISSIAISGDPRVPGLIINELKIENPPLTIEYALDALRYLKYKPAIKNLEKLLKKIEKDEIKDLMKITHKISKAIEKLEKA